MKKISALILSIFLVCISCAEEPSFPETPDRPEKIGHSISPETALTELGAVLTAIDGQTRAGSRRTIRSITSVRGTDIVPATRTRELPELEEIVYIVNFENNEGYAVLAADDRLASVIAITETGNLASEEFVAVAQGAHSHDKVLPIRPEVVAYAAGIGWGDIDGPPITPPFFTTYVTYGEWLSNSQKGPYIQIKWDQNPPYNYYSPAVSGLPDYMMGKGWVGCTAVAAGQLIAMNSHRGLFLLPNSIGNYTIDRNAVWKSIDILKGRARGHKTFSPSDQSAECRAVAYFLRAIGNTVKMKYTTSGSSTPSANVAALLSSIGYRNVSFGSYSENQVCDMINHQCPVYIEGKGYDVKEQKSLYHAWVIDGVCQQRRKVETRSLATHEVLSLKWEYRNLFHCNFGYASSYDGYYVTDIYDFHAGAEFTDPMIDNNKQTKEQGYAYTQEFKIITHAYSL